MLQKPERPLVVQRMLDQALLWDLHLIGGGSFNDGGVIVDSNDIGTGRDDLATLRRDGGGVLSGIGFLCGRT